MYDDPHEPRRRTLYLDPSESRPTGRPALLKLGAAPTPYGVDIEEIGQSTFDVLSSLEMDEAQISRAAGKAEGGGMTGFGRLYVGQVTLREVGLRDGLQLVGNGRTQMLNGTGWMPSIRQRSAIYPEIGSFLPAKRFSWCRHLRRDPACCR